MSSRAFASTDVINHGSPAILDDLPTGSLSGCFWAYPTSTSNGRVCAKSNTATNIGWIFGGVGTLGLIYYENTASGARRRDAANNSMIINTWNFVAFTSLTGTAFSDVHIYVATPAGVLTEVTYSTEQNGVGAYTTAAAESFLIGNHSDFAQAFIGRLAGFRMWNSLVTLKEFEDVKHFSGQALGAALSDPIWGISNPLSTSPVAFWRLGEASGATRVDSVGSNNLADSNTVAQIAGKVGNAAHFVQASSQDLTIADNVDLSTGDIDFTWSLWVYLDNKSNQKTLVSKWDGSTSEYVIDYLNTVDRFRFLVYHDGATQATVQADVFGSPSTATWYHIIAWHDATANTINISVNAGTPNSLSHTLGVNDGVALFALGSLSQVGAYHDGRLDAVGFWKRLLSVDEKTDLYNGGNGMQTPFDREPDLSGNGNNGLVTGTTVVDGPPVGRYTPARIMPSLLPSPPQTIPIQSRISIAQP